MFRVRVIDHFSSAHNLRGYEGNCERLHGHNWKVEIVLQGDKLDNLGMLVDFKVLKKHLKNLLDELDHTYLNEHRYFKDVNPTSENMAKYIFMRMKEIFGDLVYKVAVWESHNAVAEYFE
ncbi:MAG: 6-carboxytetrahydropterin synthase QueD [Calditerrivibrio sp.]|nr:6-carboxytetrahydropterin synthase QueD [Calditerrivibrio sp.]MCA1932324.1 6-carboxytetrahydropterin synthase QueD [Calditerrivibrio sp.]